MDEDVGGAIYEPDPTVGRQLIAEVEADLPYLDVAAERALIEFHIEANASEDPITRMSGRLPVAAIGTQIRVDDLTAANFRVRMRIAPDTVPETWGPLGLTGYSTWDGIPLEDLAATVQEALRLTWDVGVAVEFLAFELFVTKLKESGASGDRIGHRQLDRIQGDLRLEFERRAIDAHRSGRGFEAASFASAALGCSGVERGAVMSIGSTAGYRLPSDATTSAASPNLRRVLVTIDDRILREQEALITDCAGRLVEEGRAAWVERRMKSLEIAGFPFRGPVASPLTIDGYGGALFRDGMALVERAAQQTSSWLLLSRRLLDSLVTAGWTTLATVAPPHLISGLAEETGARPAECIGRIADWDASDEPWAARVKRESDETMLRVVEALNSLLT